MIKIKLYNTLTRQLEDFEPINPPNVGIYSCGPTVYDYTHIGHLRTYTNNDLLRRFLQFVGYKVKHVMNITDVGHLTGDDDSGEDKLEKGAKKHKKTVWEIAEYFTDYFFYSTDQLNILRPHIICKATEHIQEMINLIKRLEEKGYTYETKEAVYFDVSKFKNYGKLSGQSLEEKLTGVREEVHIDPQKRNPADFALWFKRVGRFKNHIMHWDSPWGDGFPGWHIECSAMSMKYLGESFDIHTGGEDHIPVHHENEIAQSEAATGKRFVKYWFHNAHLLVEGQKMSKSLGNIYTIDDIKKRGFRAISLRLLFLSAHYRQQMNFTFDSLNSAENALLQLEEKVQELRFIQKYFKKTIPKNTKSDLLKKLEQKFVNELSKDLNAPRAIAVFWKIVDTPAEAGEKIKILEKIDQVLGLGINKIKPFELKEKDQELLNKRQALKEKKEYEKADKIRDEFEKRGLKLKDLPEGTVVIKKEKKL